MKKQAFTLIEILIVIAIIAVIATVLFIALNPLQRFKDARDAQRWRDIDNIAQAVRLYQIDNQGQIPSGIDNQWRMLGTDSSSCDVACGSSGSAGASQFLNNSADDFNAGVYSDTQWDSANTWLELTSTGQSNGHGSYLSSIKDADAEVIWSTLSWVPERPTGKPLPNNKQSETEYNTANVEMSKNEFLMHLDESLGQVHDSSGNSLVGTLGTGTSHGATGKLNKALNFTGDSHGEVIIDDSSHPLDYTDVVSYGAWFKANSLRNWAGIISHMPKWPAYSGGGGYNLQVGTSQKIACGSGVYTNSDSAPTTGVWYHAVCVYDGSQMRLYVNGILQSDIDTITLKDSPADELDLGEFYTNGSSLDFDGQIDEVFIMHKALSATEVANIYRRALIQLKYQVRSCDDSSCSGETFIGPDGTGASYYSELNNTGSSLPSFSLTNINNNRYFQYRVFFETDSSSYTPELNSVTIDGSGAVLQSSCLDLSSDLSSKLTKIPQDPQNGTANKTYYAIRKKNGQQIELMACNAEGDNLIKISR